MALLCYQISCFYREQGLLQYIIWLYLSGSFNSCFCEFHKTVSDRQGSEKRGNESVQQTLSLDLYGFIFTNIFFLKIL